MIDEGETDWKVIAIDVEDPMGAELNDIDDVKAKLPGLLPATVEWFKIYKMPDGKPPNEFAFNSEFKDRAFTEKLIDTLHHQWKSMITGETSNAGMSKTCAVFECADKISNEEAKAIVDGDAAAGPDQALPEGVNKWHHVSL